MDSSADTPEDEYMPKRRKLLEHGWLATMNRVVVAGALASIFGIMIGATVAAEGNPSASYMDEREAIAAGEALGIGSARLEGPAEAEVMSHQTWTLVYTVGKAGIAPGGGIRVGMRHVVQWTPPQTEKPEEIGYLTVKTDPPVPTSIYIEYQGTPGPKRLSGAHFPWQNMIEVTLPERGLDPGDTIRVTYGDRSGGSRGIRVQPFDEEDFTFKTYVDAHGHGDYLPINNSPTVDIVAADPFRLGVVMPSDAGIDEPTWCIVRVEDRYGNPATRYRGTVRFTATDPTSKLPQPYTFTEADRGVHRFENVLFKSEGAFTLHVTDGEFERRGNPVRVHERRPDNLLLWGDLHGHTLFSDGRGTVEQFYDFADRVAGLDVCAVTDHAFEIVDWMWEHSKDVTNDVYEPGRFVTFQAYEWSGQTAVGGDHNVFFLDDDPPLHRSRTMYNYRNLQMYHGPTPQINHVEDLFAMLVRDHEHRRVFCIPHWGGRRGNPEWHDPRVQRMVEVFSEHQRSGDWMLTFLRNGHRLGIIASTDGHYGNPGYGYLKPTYDWTTQEIGMAAVAIYAPERTRESVFDALYNRHVYATSGDRIILDVRADEFVMGSEIVTANAPTIDINAIGTDVIQRVEIKKNGEVVHVEEPGQQEVGFKWVDPQFDPSRVNYYYVRVIQANNEEAISSPIWVN